MAKLPYTVGQWKGEKNYHCKSCFRADLDKDRLLLSMASRCPREDCPGKPKITTKAVTVPLLNAKSEPITERPMTDKERATNTYDRRTSVPPHEKFPPRREEES